MEVKEVKEISWANAQKTAIDCKVNHPRFGWIPFTARADDAESNGHKIFEACAAGKHGPVGAYVPPQVIVRVPAFVQMRQARLALLAAGLLGDVDAAINAIEDVPAKKAAKIEWEYATEVRRCSALIAHLAPALGMTDKQLDELFIAAAAL